MKRAKWLLVPLLVTVMVTAGAPAFAVSDANLTVLPSTTTPVLGNPVDINFTFTQGPSPTTHDVYVIVSFPASSRDVTWTPGFTCGTSDPISCGPNGDTLVVHWFAPFTANQVLHATMTVTALTVSPLVATVRWQYDNTGDFNLSGNITLNATSSNNASIVVAASSVLLSRTTNFTVTVTKASGVPFSGEAIIAFPSAFLTMAGDCPVTGRIAVCPIVNLNTNAVYNFSSTVDTLYTGVFSTQGVLVALNNFDNTAADNISTKNCTAVSALVITC